MKPVLIAEDEPVARRVLRNALEHHGYPVLECRNGGEAMEALCGAAPPALAVLDWNMPVLSGPEICAAVRDRGAEHYTYMLLLTARTQTDDVVEGLKAGADDFLRKPFDPAELIARLRVGERILSLEHNLEKKIAELRSEQAHVRQLQDMIPICVHCRKVKSDSSWEQIEMYLVQQGSSLSHGLCEECLDKHYPD